MTRSITIAGNGAAAPFFAERLAGMGHEVACLPRGDAEPARLDLVFLLPRDIIECEALLFDEARLARRAAPPAAIILCATLSPRYVRALRARVPAAIALIDAPVVGTQRQIEGGVGSFLLGGETAAIAPLVPMFDRLGRSAARMGGFGAGAAAKALRDCFAAATSAMTRSALDWASAQGIEEGRLIRLLESAFDTRGAGDIADPAALVANALPGDEAGVTLVRNVENALDLALKGVHLTPPRSLAKGFSSVRSRHLH